ncbi:MAG: LacI family DNA-binding transcriptional regulator [Anaerolineae bacterium]|jgi:DNA-binding LacI/PurR family transcriptional regulator|nr:LacI family DNA-binding transcriptional regulator [Anaerolineae bacterium]
MNFKRVTIKEVAAAAGVSTQTVSRVVNDRPDVASDTREHVQQVIDDLGYQPSKIARSLIRGRSYSLGVVSSSIGLYGPSLLLQGIQEAAVEEDYSLMLNILPNAEVFDANQVLREILSYHVDGILWAVPEIGQNRDLIQQALPNLTVPIVFLNAQPRPNLVTAVIDNKHGGRIATQHLIAQGRQNIGLITGPMNWWEARQREQGWREEVAANGRLVDESFIANGDWTPSSGERCIRMLLEWHPEMDAVFICNDQMALGAMKVARQMGRQIPQDLAIVGFDDIPESPYFSPSLTTVRQDVAEMGRQGVKQLLTLLDDEENLESPSVVLQPKLIVRESSVMG